MPELVEADLEDLEQAGRQPFQRQPGHGGDLGVEAELVAEDAQDQLPHQALVFGREVLPACDEERGGAGAMTQHVAEHLDRSRARR